MRKSLIINAHSVVDVITNSSSELFVGEKKVSIKFVKDVLQEFLNAYNLATNQNKPFDKVFGKIYKITPSNLEEFIKDYVIGWGYSDWKIELHEIPEYLTEIEVLADGTIRERGHRSGDEVDWDATHKKRDELRDTWYKNNISDGMRKKLIGRICIQSKEDNSIPYELFDLIQTAFNAKSIHLG